MVLPRDRPTTLADVAKETAWLTVDCRCCGRHGRLRVARLIREHGAGALLWQLVEALAKDCPRRGETQPYELCWASCPTLSQFINSTVNR